MYTGLGVALGQTAIGGVLVLESDTPRLLPRYLLRREPRRSLARAPLWLLSIASLLGAFHSPGGANLPR
jgi:hypothetical protein